MRISDWSSDVCSSDLYPTLHAPRQPCLLSSAPLEDTPCPRDQRGSRDATQCRSTATTGVAGEPGHRGLGSVGGAPGHPVAADLYPVAGQGCQGRVAMAVRRADRRFLRLHRLQLARSEEHTSELQSLMRISYAVFCLKK